MRRRTSRDSRNTSRPATRALPEVAGRKPDSIRIVVLLPAPLGPSRPTISPRPTWNDTFSTAVRPANRFVSCDTSIIQPSFIATARMLGKNALARPT